MGAIDIFFTLRPACFNTSSPNAELHSQDHERQVSGYWAHCDRFWDIDCTCKAV